MVASVDVVRQTDVGPTNTVVTSATSRLSTSDAPAPGSADPIPIPGAGTNHSFWATFRLNATTTPDGTINNIRFYSDGSNGLGTGVTVTGMDSASYVQATGTQGTSGNELTTANHAGLTGTPVDVFGWTSGSPKTVPGSLVNPSTGEFGNRMVLQSHVADTASPGSTPAETFTFVYDET